MYTLRLSFLLMDIHNQALFVFAEETVDRKHEDGTEKEIKMEITNPGSVNFEYYRVVEKKW